MEFLKRAGKTKVVNSPKYNLTINIIDITELHLNNVKSRSCVVVSVIFQLTHSDRIDSMYISSSKKESQSICSHICNESVSSVKHMRYRDFLLFSYINTIEL
ncbi:hypothetical protein FACS1894206_03640 [Deltaproteobacteria bacterium]|nr:hypothetical protein FACS1894206_03640 [Deltaproteobacteria bacterium]